MKRVNSAVRHHQSCRQPALWLAPVTKSMQLTNVYASPSGSLKSSNNYSCFCRYFCSFWQFQVLRQSCLLSALSVSFPFHPKEGMIHYAMWLRRANRMAETLLDSQWQRECPFHQPHPAHKSHRPGITEMSWSLSPPAKKGKKEVELVSHFWDRKSVV